ncbi:MAG TPA: hypothetical protein VIU61_16095 [Kofleriaceae bacterium]
MADTGGDESKEIAIAATCGIAGPQWLEAKAYYTAKMTDPNDMGRTALAFMPLYQAAQARARAGVAPCTLELYTRVRAEMAYRKDQLGNRINYHLVLAEHGFTHTSWLECEGYWTPRVASNADPKFDLAASMRFRELMQTESDRLSGSSVSGSSVSGRSVCGSGQ